MIIPDIGSFVSLSIGTKVKTIALVKNVIEGNMEQKEKLPVVTQAKMLIIFLSVNSCCMIRRMWRMLGQQIRRETADRLDLRHLDHLATLAVVTMARSTIVIVAMSTMVIVAMSTRVSVAISIVESPAGAILVCHGNVTHDYHGKVVGIKINWKFSLKQNK